MKKKCWISLGLALLLLVMAAVPVAAYTECSAGAWPDRIFPERSAAPDGAYVVDEYGLLSETELETLNEYAARVSKEYTCGVYIMIVDDYNDYDTGNAEDSFEVLYTYYHDNEMGEGDGRDGVILMLSMSQSHFVFFVYGDRAEYALNSDGQIVLEESFVSFLSDAQWAEGLEAYIKTCEEALSLARAGTPIRSKHYAAYIIGYIIAVLIAFLVCLFYKASMKSVYKKTEASHYVSAGSLEITHQEETFLRETVTVREKSDDSSGGSKSHSGGGGSGRSGSF